MIPDTVCWRVHHQEAAMCQVYLDGLNVLPWGIGSSRVFVPENKISLCFLVLQGTRNPLLQT